VKNFRGGCAISVAAALSAFAVTGNFRLALTTLICGLVGYAVGVLTR